MPRRVFTYPAGLGCETLNLISTIGAFVLAAGLFLFLFDLLRRRATQKWSNRNPWNAGTLEWLTSMPGESWGVRCIPVISSRYPLWDQPNLMRDIDQGRFYLADAEEGRRETLITSTIDATIVYCLRVPGPTWLTLWAAIFTAGIFIAGTYHWWYATLVSSGLAVVTIWAWLWTGTAVIPEKPEKDVGLQVTAPLYLSGPQAVGWWAMFITMLGDMTAFLSLIFGYFFYWTIHADFPPANSPGPGVGWLLGGGTCIACAWIGCWACMGFNRRDNRFGFYIVILVSLVTAVGGLAAMLAGPWTTGLDPTQHVYPAIVWVLVGWTSLHLGLGALMIFYCWLRRAFGRMTQQYDADIVNVTLYWHFMAITTLITVGVVAGFPLVNS
ncbi:MAG: hypothetical protein IT423_12295 [Pirellulaceae bacterium]|nr:hypothetical protein [Pirellulaceae bacterium]